MTDFKEVKDSGKRQSFNTGSVRDTDEGKGQPHLIAGEALYRWKVDLISKFKNSRTSILDQIEIFLLSYNRIDKERDTNLHHNYDCITLIIEYISDTEDGKYNSAMRRLAQHYQNGAKKYAKNNWRKGQPISRYYDSAMRHLWKLIDKMDDEDHAAALFWNLIAIIQTKLDIEKGLLPKELNDFPFTIEETFPKIKEE
jgi:hypothetical protein